MTVLLAVDLDQTLIYSRSALDLSMPDDQAPALVCMEMLDHRPHSFMTLAAYRLWEAVGHRHVVVPTTTRTESQFRRVRLAPARYAVISNGGALLVDGIRDAAWTASVHERVADGSAPLAEVRAALRANTSDEWVLKYRLCEELFCYLVTDPAGVPPGFVAEWSRWCAERGWSVSVQGRKIYAIPDGVSKHIAIAEVRRRCGADRMIAAGDGALDAGLLEAADAAIRPAHGELAAKGWTRPHVAITRQVGVLGGEEIVRWLGDQADDYSCTTADPGTGQAVH